MKTNSRKHVAITILLIILFVFSGRTAMAQVSVTASSGNPGPTSYTTLSSAFAAINTGTHMGDITIDISSSFTEVATSILNASGTGTAIYTSVLVRPVNDAIIISFASAQGRGLIELNGADSVVIDGDNPFTSGINRNLTFTNTAANTSTFTSVIRVAADTTALYTDANGIIIKNLVLNGSATGRNQASITLAASEANTTFGVVAGPRGGATVTALNSVSTGLLAGASINRFTVENCAINQCGRGIAFIGTADTSSTGVTITNNIIGNQTINVTGAPPFASPVTTVYAKGIVVQGTRAVTISGNTIKNITSYLAVPLSAIELVSGIGNGTISISNNNINTVALNAITANGARGIYVASAAGPYNITSNTITNIQNNSASSAQQPAGIQVGTTAPSATITLNKVWVVYNRGTSSYGANGILLNGGNNITVSNNLVSDINQDISTSGSFGSLYSIFGIRLALGTGHKVYHNSVHLFGAAFGTPATSQSSFAFSISAAASTGCDVRNNIFSNTISVPGGTLGNAHTAIYLPSSATTMNLTLNNNAYYSGTDTATQGIAQIGGTPGTGFYLSKYFNQSVITTKNLRAYTRTISPAGTNDSNSVAYAGINPFISNTDLHLPSGVASVLESSGATVPVSTDIDNDPRPGPAGSIHGGAVGSDIGADEADMIPVNIVFDSSLVEQIISPVLPGTMDQVVLKVRIHLSGSVNPPSLTSVKFNTAGSTAAADIGTAKVYTTGSSGTFSTATLVGSAVASPNGSFYITGSQVLNKGVNYLWLVYDVSLTAGVGNVLDATLDSLLIGGVNYAPVNGNPSGNLVINNPMTYISSSVSQSDTSKLGVGTKNNYILGLTVVTSAIGTPVNLTQIDFNTNGTTDTSDIRNIKVWYTGASNIFDTLNQVGSTLPMLPGTTGFSVTGSRALINGNNYFWLTYDISTDSSIGNMVDAEVAFMIIDGVTQTPANAAPAGARMIRLDYCPAPYSNPCSNGDFVNNFSTTGALVNISNLNSGCIGNANSHAYYRNQTITAEKGSTVTFHYQGSGVYAEGFRIWIDYNQDGSFDATEEVASAAASLNMNHSKVTISCDALEGVTRLRIRDVWNAMPVNACISQSYGETEDYNINIISNPVHYQSAGTVQITGKIPQGSVDKPILRIPVKVYGCGVATTSMFYFNTAGTSSTGDIVSAKLYTTGNSPVFNTNKQVGSTISFPSGAFTFAVTDTLINNDTNNYWLVYDINPSAMLGNVVDAVIDSIEILGSNRIPAGGNPAGNISIELPETFVSATATQTLTEKVFTNTTNNRIIGVEVVMSSTGSPVNLTALSFNSNGTTDTANIRNIRVWYTGNNKNFSTGTQFGTTLFALPGTTSYTIASDLPLLNDTNYFWLTYDMPNVPAAGNLLDAEFTGLIVDATPQVPVVTAPAGNRGIRYPYCVPTQSGGVLISNVTLNTLNHSPAPATTPFYTVFNPTGTATTAIEKATPYQLSVTTTQSAIVSVWIDANDDGSFVASEWQQVAVSTAAGVPSSVMITVPCSAVTGEVKMRIRSRTAGQVNTALNSCTIFGAGETQDYTITIVDNPADYNYSTAIQISGIVSGGAPDQPILRIPVRTNGCGVGTVTTFNFSTNGSTNPASDITAAKLYVTGSSTVFSTAKQVGTTIVSPNGAFSFSVTDTLINNDTTNYWLTYDINSFAAVNNFIDATLDSIEVTGSFHTPAVTDPTGNLQVYQPMIYLSSTTTQDVVSRVGKGTSNNQVIGLQVITTSTGSPVNMLQLNLDANGTTDTSNIRNIKVWYTGNSKIFATNTQFGTTLPVLPGTTAFSIAGSLPLANDTNYFWVTYDIDAGSLIGNVVDAECASFVLSSGSNVPSVVAPAGSRQIRENYCVPTFTYPCSNGDFVNHFYTTGGINNITNMNTGCSGTPDSYIHYTSQVLTARRGGLITLNYRGSGAWDEGFRIWIDYDQDGIFSPTEEVAGAVASKILNQSVIIIPATAAEGLTRLRIRDVYNAQPASACFSEFYGETEDYDVYILPEESPVIYTWNQVAPADFNTAANWTPSRLALNVTDVLQFNNGGTVTATNIHNHLVSRLIVDNNTTVNLQSPAPAKLNVTDTLDLFSGSIICNNNLLIELGTDTVETGLLRGTGTIQPQFKRWVNSISTSYLFPLATGTNNRSADLDFTSPFVASGSLTASYINNIGGSGGLPLTDAGYLINRMTDAGWWALTPGDGLTGGVYDGSFTGEGIAGISNYTQLVLLNRIDNTLPWTIKGTHVITGGSNAVPVLSRTGIDVYNEFAIGSDSNVNLLPVKWLSFEASANAGNAVLEWSTANENNNKGFEIERSVNGRTFEYTGFIKGKQNSNTKTNYTATDARAFEKTGAVVLYYRLKQIDLNGQYTYSTIRMVNGKGSSDNVLSPYPNPFSDVVSLNIQSNGLAETAVVEVTDLSGRKVLHKQYEINKGSQVLQLEEAATWQDGIYFLRLIIGDDVLTVKLVKNK